MANENNNNTINNITAATVNEKQNSGQVANNNITTGKPLTKASAGNATPAGTAKPASIKKAALVKKAAKTVAKKDQIIHETPPVTQSIVSAAKASPTTDTSAKEKTVKPTSLKLVFLLRYHTSIGQSLFITGNHELFGDKDVTKAPALQYLDKDFWHLEINIPLTNLPAIPVTYNYVLKNTDGSVTFDWGSDKILIFSQFTAAEVLIIDAWNFAGYYENAFYSEPFKNVLLKSAFSAAASPAAAKVTHRFKVKAPLLTAGQAIFIGGNNDAFNNWNTTDVALLSKTENDDYWTIDADLTDASFPLLYKYGVYDVTQKKFIRYEDGDNRVLYDGIKENKQTIVNDGFAVLPNNTWRAAGVAIPVFSLRSSKSFGVGEFTDLKLLVDWAKQTGLKLLQILPINDTNATNSWVDSYPYAAISAFALHPMYLNLSKTVSEENKHLLDALSDEQKRLNALDAVDYEAVNKTKWQVINQIYPSQHKAVFASDDYNLFFNNNKHWLVPYAAFCFLKDKYHTADFNLWPVYKNYIDSEVAALVADEANFDAIAVHYFVQYHLHLQLKDATDYAHDNSVVVKGDIPIGIYRYGADAWQQPELYHMNLQAGAPPDDFAVTGQNWGFPTYNWQKMMADGFAWWKLRFEQMSYYFDAFRIDHILGFFRIWSIPIHAVDGIMGYFDPAIPVHINEFNERNIWFDYKRYCKPFINNEILNNTFGDQQDYVRAVFLDYQGYGEYKMKDQFATQRQVEKYFEALENNPHNSWLKQALYNLISNVVLFEVEGSNGLQYHFRFNVDSTSSFQSLEGGTQYQLKDLYINYFFRRQDDFWKKEAMQKLPALKQVTNMLVCGEDLGLVPTCVPDVMRQLGLLSLEIQRMPKDPAHEFFNPNDAPYLSVVTPSTHDMSTIRGWWEEDRTRIQKFYNQQLGRGGDASYFCEAPVNKAIVVQHLHSPAMWSIFQLQDLLGINREIRRANPNEERINVPSIPHFYWRYRMHLTLENLIKADAFNNELKQAVAYAGR